MATHLINLAASYSRSKNYVEAERLLRTCLNIMKNSVGSEDQSITFPMLNLAVTLSQLNRDEEAEQIALKVLRIREKAFDKDSLPVGIISLFHNSINEISCMDKSFKVYFFEVMVYLYVPLCRRGAGLFGIDSGEIRKRRWRNTGIAEKGYDDPRERVWFFS